MLQRKPQSSPLDFARDKLCQIKTRREIAMHLQPATLEDLKSVASWITSARECELWAGWRVKFPIDLESLPAELEFQKVPAFALYDEGQIVAFGQIGRREVNRGALGRIIVSPAARRRGYGEYLVRSLIDNAKAQGCVNVSLYVDRLNPAALALYAKLGFRDEAPPIHRPETAGSYYMELDLSGSQASGA